MPWEAVRDWMLFATVVLGGGLALAPAPRDDLSAAEAWLVGTGIALGLLAGAVFAAFAAGLGNRWFATGFLAVGAALLARRQHVVRLWRDETVREILFAWMLVSAGTLAMLAAVFSYSGGAWTGDWEDQYQRTLIILRMQAENEAFRHMFRSFTTRPPLANLADAGFLWATNAGFARHQVFMLLLNSLVFLPVALFARTFGGGRGAAAAAGVAVLLNPLFLQNSTYAWTKLIAAFFVLSGLHLFLTREPDRRRTVLAALLMALGMLTHYSACVWLLVFGGTWLLLARPRWRESSFRKTVLAAMATVVAVFSPWLAFAIARYGVADTFGSNTAYHEAARYGLGENLLNAVPKVWHNLVPHLLRGYHSDVLAQTNRWTWLRDEVFCDYQGNLLIGAGLFSLVLLVTVAWRPDWRPRLAPARVWWWAVPGVVVLGSAVHDHVDPLGDAHICLVPLILLGVALAASRLARLFAGGAPRWLALALMAGAGIDLFFGIGLHYAASAMQLNRDPGMPLFTYANGLSRVAQYNLSRKISWGQDYFADTANLPWWGGLIILIALVALLGLRSRRLAPNPA